MKKKANQSIDCVHYTEKRSMEKFLSLISEGKVNVKPLISYKFPIDKYKETYNLISTKAKSNKKVIAILFEHAKTASKIEKIKFVNNKKVKDKVGVSIIGAGNFTKTTLLPNLTKFKNKIDLVGIASSRGSSADILSKKYNFVYSTSEYKEVLRDPNTDLVFVTVPHNLHASFAIEALKSGKDVFVEKPLAINIEQLEEIKKAKLEYKKRLMVGINRRFAPLTQWIKELIGNESPLIISYRINAGIVPINHWINDPNIGGGRIIGEVCHFVDFMIYMFNSYPVNVYGSCINRNDSEILSIDNCVFNIKFENGSMGNILYESIDPEILPKERVEILGRDFAGLIDNFIRGEFYKGGKVIKKRLIAQDKGFLNEYRKIIESIQNGEDFPIPFEDFVYTTLTTFALNDSVSLGQPVQIDRNIWR